MRLAQVEQFQVPAKIVRQTEETLRAAGAKGCEAFVLWSGRQNGPLFNILTVHVPKQNAYCLSSGLCVRVDGDELHRLNVWLYEADEILAIQIHAHPDGISFRNRRHVSHRSDAGWPFNRRSGVLPRSSLHIFNRRIPSPGRWLDQAASRSRSGDLMALAEYYERAALAASQIIAGFAPDLFRRTLEQANVGLAIDKEAATSSRVSEHRCCPSWFEVRRCQSARNFAADQGPGGQPSRSS